MEFVSFHVSLGSRQMAHPNQTLEHDEYMAMLAMMFASARLFEGRARSVLLTDERTQMVEPLRRVDQIVRSPIDVSKLMLERARMQLQHVEASGFQMPMVILDSDILINQSMRPVFEEDFDVALTWRASSEQPINGGFMILNNRRPEAARRFFRRFTSIYIERYAEQANWFGDQLALRDCVGLSHARMARRRIVEVEGCRILLLPCETYNFSPDNRWAEIGQDLQDKTILHFKGERKRLMAPYWHAWLRPRQSWAPWVQYRARRERRELLLLAAEESPTANEIEPVGRGAK